jgi:hypothetical protein
VFAREASGARQRIRHAQFPAHKTLEDFDRQAQPAAERPLVMHLAQLAWIDERAAQGQELPAQGAGRRHRARRPGSVATRLRLSGRAAYRVVHFAAPESGALFGAP